MQPANDSSGDTIKVLLVDDHTMVREGFRQLIQDEGDMEVVGEAHSGNEAVKMIRNNHTDVVLMDIVMPEMNGIEATHQILRAHPDVKVMGLSIYSDQQYVRDMLRNGASGYVLKNAPFRDLVKAIRTVMDGQVYLSESIPRSIFQEALTGDNEDRESGDLEKLTHREKQVLQLMAEGNQPRQIAEILDIGVKTVSTYRWRMMQKLDIHSNAELTQFAIKEGLIKL